MTTEQLNKAKEIESELNRLEEQVELLKEIDGFFEIRIGAGARSIMLDPEFKNPREFAWLYREYILNKMISLEKEFETL